ncbi:glycosyltransferase family 4 protein [Bacillus timonensis]|uniref:Glycosyltransferase family 4 protein n=1 Tax=Bacillus timonensis TaxID=1033734 RepID=A0A4S3PY81_9BACI|nr:glycosyltransferase [Bacillus timonensis]THE14032.1 glycosyltransferase family 4 protein [Bacillus timonensis]
MRVLFISRLYPNKYDSRNGAVMHRQALELKKNGVDVRVISPIPFVPSILKNVRHKWLEYSMLPYRDSYEGIEIYYPRFIDFPYGLNDGRLYKSIIKSTDKIIESIYSEFPFDLVHAHMAYPDNYAGIYVKDRYKVPLITTIRSTDMDISIKKNKLKKLLEISLGKSNKIVSPSLQLSKKLKTNFNLDSIHLGNGIYPNVLMEELNEKELEKSLRGKLENKRVILSISNLIESKGIQYNILAVSKLVAEYPNILYLVIGDGPYEAKLKELVNSLNLENHVKFLGALKHPEAMMYLSLCDIFSMPSWRETFGLVYLEAMFFKKPIILCEDQGMDGSVSHAVNGIIVPPHSIDALVSNIKRLFNDDMFTSKLVENGYELVLNEYDWAIIGKKLLGEYREILNSN